MKEINDAIKHRLHQKNLTGQSIGALIVHWSREWADYPNELAGYIRHGQFFVKLDKREDTTRWFHKREYYRAQINKKLKAHGYELQIRAVRIK